MAARLVETVIADKEKKELKGRWPSGNMVGILSAILSWFGRMLESPRRIKSTCVYESLGNSGMCSKFADGASRSRSDASN